MLSLVTVLDFSTTLPGPYCTMLLAGFGANVIKIERPDRGDPMREWDPWIFENLNRNKRSVTLDLKSESGKQSAYELVRHADVVVEGFRPGVMSRLGLDFETLKAINPRLIYCSISGFGQTGPDRDVPGHDLNYMALAGALGMTGYIEPDPEEGHIQKVPFSDFSSGVYASTLILANLHAKERRAVHIDLSMTDIIHSWVLLKSGHTLRGESPVAEPHYGTFQTKDGKFVVLGIMEDHFWQAFCERMKLYDWVDDPSLAVLSERKRRSQEVIPRVREAIAGWDRDALTVELQAAGIPCTPVYSVREALQDPQLLERQVLVQDQDDASGYRLNIPVKGVPFDSMGSAPPLGAHTEEICRQYKLQK